MQRRGPAGLLASWRHGPADLKPHDLYSATAADCHQTRGKAAVGFMTFLIDLTSCASEQIRHRSGKVFRQSVSERKTSARCLYSLRKTAFPPSARTALWSSVHCTSVQDFRIAGIQPESHRNRLIVFLIFLNTGVRIRNRNACSERAHHETERHPINRISTVLSAVLQMIRGAPGNHSHNDSSAPRYSYLHTVQN